MNRNFERGGSRKTGTRRLRKFWKVCAWGLSISMILGTGNIGSYIVTADDGEVQVTEIPVETSEPETETSEEPVFSVSPESTPSPEAAAYAVTEMTPAPSESTQPSESPAWTAAPEPSAISTLIPETAAPEPSAESTVLPETAEPVSSPVATEAPASMPEMSFEKKEETTGITVSVKAEAGTFPEGTTMELSPVENQSILEDAKQASELQNPSAVAVDITFRDPEGTIIEPQKQIRVTMTSDVIRQAESVDVVHVPDQAEDTSTAVVDQVPDQNLSKEEKPAEDQVVFDADQFSVYAIVYTVDFTFSGYTYSMEGGSSILLSSLASQLGLHDSEHDKDFDITEVAGVSFSDPSLVSIEQRDNDYMLTSLQPFTSDETLTIAMNDGSKYLVDVKDEVKDAPDITGNLTDATIKIDGKDVTGDTWNVKANNSYVIALSFTEQDKSSFPDDDTWMVYKVPAGLKVDDLNTTFDMVVDGKTISGNRMVVDKTAGLIKLQWNKNDPNFKTLIASSNLKVGIEIHASFDADAKEIKFSDNVTRTVNVDSTHNARVSKTGWYDSSDGKIHYTVTVDSSGTSKNVVVTDNITGKALTYDDGSVQYPSGKNITINKNGNGFTAMIPSMSDGETVTFNYTASVNFDKLTGNGNKEETANGVTIDCPGDNKTDDNSATYVENQIPYSSISKNKNKVDDTYEENGKTYRDISWTITANTERKRHLKYISDSIAADSQNIMTYSGKGLTIVVTHEDGNQENRIVNWTDSDISKTDTEWTYKPPLTDGKASYVVTYTTKADVTNLIDSRNVSNRAETNYSSATGSATVGPSGENQFNASKKATAVSSDKVTWEITVDVPASGLDKLVVTDALPTQYINNHNVYDLLDKEITVIGLDGREDYISDTSDPSKFVLTFYKDKDHKNAGMNSSGIKRTVTIRYTTTVNKEWVEYSGQHKEEAYLMTHTNKANVSVPGIDKGIEAQVTITNSEQTIKKEEAPWDKGMYTDADGTIWQYYSYNIILSGVTEDNLTLEDTFDKKYLKYFDGTYDQWGNVKDGANCIYGGDQYGQNSGRQKVTVQETSTGIKINTGALPRQNGAFYSYYRIHYYLKAKLDDLQKLAAKEGGTTTLRNSVKWGTQGASADVSYSYPGINKTCHVNGNVATYTIEANPGALELNDGKPMQLVDTFENQVIDYSTIAIKDQNGQPIDPEQYPYDFSGNQVTFTIPDSTHVTITYQARPVGKVGSPVTMANKAEMKTYHSETSDQMTFGGNASGSGEIYHLHLMKYADGKAGVRLPGAVFQLFDENEKALQYDKGDKKGKDITFTTDEKGDVDIRLSAGEEYSKGLEPKKIYKLKEIQAPDGYQLADGYISFKISDDGSADPKQNLYVNGGTLAVADKKITEVSITLKKVDSGDMNKPLPGAVFNLYGSDYINSDRSVNASAKPINQSRLETGAGGTVSLGTLKSGTYYLVETEAPDGYTKETEPITVTVADDGVTVMQGTNTKKPEITDGASGQTATITVTNSAGYVLPSTGGPGNLPWVAPGILLMLLAGTALTVRKLLIIRSAGEGGGSI